MFEDNSSKVKANLQNSITAFLHEASGELVAQIKRITPVGDSDTQDSLKSSWSYQVDGNTAKIGSPLERAIWNEFGTGSFAENGDGRKGWWVYVKGGGGSESTNKKAYTEQEARRIVAMMRADGLEAYMTNGHRPRKTLRTAYTNTKPTIEKIAKQRLIKL